jgi:proteic killer suppression protein
VAKFSDSQGLGRRAAEPVSRAGFDAAIDLLLALNVAKSLNDLSPLKSVGLHKLKGDRRRQWAMTVNERWRICFEFRKDDAYEVEIVDYHRG